MDGRLRVLAVLAGMLLMHSPVSAAALPKPTHTNKSRFRIPFKFDAAALQRMNAREVQLHVSNDRGQTWELAQSLAPDVGKFDYQAASDGEYWFAVKTLDTRNQLHPPRGSYETGLVVIIDNSPPVLDFSIQQIGAGKVQLTWQATDSNLDASSLRAEYQVAGSPEWEAILLVPTSNGETSWSISHSAVVSVRGSVSDLAGNAGRAKTQISVNATTERGIKLRNHHRGPVADTNVDHGGDSTNPDVVAIPKMSEKKSADSEYQGPVITPQGGLPQYSAQSATRPSAPRAEVTQETWPANGATDDSGPFQNASNGSLRTKSARSQFVSQPSPQAEEPPPVRRASARQRVVSNHRFQIGYELEEVGPSGVGSVELFITENNGRKWWKYGDDPDKKSPFDVEVPRDGVYGFAIRVRSGAGLSTDPPLPGELPGIIVAVDQTAPTVELLPIQQGQGSNASRLLIRWKITEEHPSEKAVSLYYAANLNGPWEPISGWKDEPNGSFEWTVGPGVPTRFFIRVAARDAAGNVGKAETQTPIVVDRIQPSARIIDVEAGSGPQ